MTEAMHSGLLICEDQKTCDRILQYLRKDCLLDVTNDRLAIKQYKEHQYDFIITDYRYGQDLVNRLHQHFDLSQTVILVIVDNSEESDDCLQWNITDFVLRSCHPAMLKHRLEMAYAIIQAYKTIDHLKYDDITGLYTKEYFYQNVKTILDKYPHLDFDMVCSDIESFSMINDQFGFDKGNDLLRHIAKYYLRFVDEKTIAGRIDADHFAMLTPHKKISDIISDSEAYHESKKTSPVPNVVVKYSVYENIDHHLNAVMMYDRARLAMHQNKHDYNIKIAYYDDGLRLEAKRRKELIDEMELALQNRQFEVYYQPKHLLKDQSVHGAEALVRWNHPTRGLLMPNEFIPLFESNGFIWRLDQYIFARVCQDLHHWIQEKIPVVPISINLSRKDFSLPYLVEDTVTMIEYYNIDPRFIHFEVTETAYTDNPQAMIEIVKGLQNAGFLIELDDFGTGYSSLNMLNQVPINILKLDRQIVSKNNLLMNKTILAYTVSLANCMGLVTVAEGVEDYDQAIRLHELGCDIAQGFLYSPAIKAKDFTEYLCKYEVSQEEVNKDPLNYQQIMIQNQIMMKKELREKDEVIRMVHDNLQGGLKGCIDDDKMTIVYLSNSLSRMLGYHYDEFIKANQGSSFDFVYHEDLEATRKKIKHDFAHGIQYAVRYRAVKKDGSLLWVYEAGQKTLDDSGRYRINSIVQDIDEIQKMIERLQLKAESEEILLQCIAILVHKDYHYDELNNMLKLLEKFYGASRSYIIEYNQDLSQCQNIYQWGDTSFDLNSDSGQLFIKEWFTCFLQQKTYHLVLSLDTIQYHHNIHTIAKKQDIENMMITPLIRDKEMVGLIAVDNPTVNMDYTRLLTSMSYFVDDYLSRR